MENIINGTDLCLFFSASTGYTTIAAATSHKLDLKMKTRDTSSKDSGTWEDSAAGRLSWSISSDALVTADPANFSFANIFDLFVNRTQISLISCISNTATGGTQSVGTQQYQGNAIITDLSEDAKSEDNVTFSMTLQGCGKLSRID